MRKYTSIKFTFPSFSFLFQFHKGYAEPRLLPKCLSSTGDFVRGYEAWGRRGWAGGLIAPTNYLHHIPEGIEKAGGPW